MEQGVVADIVRRLRDREPGTRISVDDDAELPLGPGHFRELPPARKGRLLFVDGGNAEVLGGPGFSLQLVRTAWLLFDGTECVERRRKEGLVLVRAIDADSYRIDGFGLTPPVTSFSRRDRALARGRHAVEPQAVAEEVRGLLELETAAELAALAAPAMAVRDGSLVPETAAGAAGMARLAEACRKRDAILAGLAKTSGSVTDTGMPAGDALLRLRPGGTWLYAPEGSMHSFARLHDRSRHIFRLDTEPGRLPEAAGLLRAHAADAGFPGYPYGLVAADRLARVARQEADQQRAVFLATAGRELQALVAGRDAHGILDHTHR
jgi:hypothetical protein